jgi:DNA-binding winged helix-turn-helix (wHTH) protein
LQAHGLLVTKEELMSRLRLGIVVSEENLKVQVAALRKALGADPDFIHTEFGRGYRFTGVVRLNPAAEAERYSTPANLGVIDLIPAKMAAVAEVLLQSQLKSEAGNSAAFALQVPLHFRCVSAAGFPCSETGKSW